MTAMVVLTAIMLALPAAALALPSETPDRTAMVDGRVRAIEQVGTNVWVGGRFSRVERRNGKLLDNVGNLAVLDSQKNTYKPIAPNLGGTGAEVWDIEAYGRTGDLLIAGKFYGPSSTQENLVLVDGATGEVIRWYDAPSLKTVLAAPGFGRVYGGGRSLSAFEFATGKRLWTRAKTSVDPTRRTHDSKPAYRDLELDGRTIWAACICDAVNGEAAKALVKLDLRGNVLIIDHGAGVYSTYAHLSEALVHQGDEVKRDQVIAHVGHTGLSTGPHLHWEVWVGGVVVDPVDWTEREVP